VLFQACLSKIEKESASMKQIQKSKNIGAMASLEAIVSSIVKFSP